MQIAQDLKKRIRILFSMKEVSHLTDLATSIFQTIHITRKTILYCTSYFHRLELLDSEATYC